MKRKISLVLVLAVIITLTSCKPKESPQDVVQKAIEAVKIMDIESMQNYWGQEKLTDAFDTASETETDSDALSTLKLLVKNLDYQIVDAIEEDETATVSVQITNLDMAQIMSEFIATAFENTLSNAYLSEDQKPTNEEIEKQYTEMLISYLEREGNPTITNTVDIKLSLVDNKWVIEYNEDAIDAMLGGLNSFSNSLNDAFKGNGENNT